VFRLTLPRTHGAELRESPLPLAPAIELAPVTVVEEPVAAEEPGEIELTEAEITWQPAEPVD
jgi:two-component system sensor histidine kinase MtrB